MIISELLPNPTGKDTDGEFIELWNNGTSHISIEGYSLQDKSGKNYVLHGALDSKAFLNLPYSVTKINLNNTGDVVYLFDSSGQLIDKAEYLLQAKEGASLARRADGIFDFTAKPTPGVANIFNEIYVSKENFTFEQAGANISNSLSGFDTWALIILASMSLSLLFVYFLKDVIHPKEYILE